MMINLNKSNSPSVFIIIALILIIGFFTLHSHAVMVKFSLRELTQGAAVILTADVSDVHCEWSLDRKIIMTVVTLAVKDAHKGTVQHRMIHVQIPGGELDGIGLRVSDMPEYSQGERVLVFLKEIPAQKNPENSPTVIQDLLPAFETYARAQGKFSIDSDGNAKREGYRLIGKDPAEKDSIPLEELKTRIKNFLEETRGRREKNNEKRR